MTMHATMRDALEMSERVAREKVAGMDGVVTPAFGPELGEMITTAVKESFVQGHIRGAVWMGKIACDAYLAEVMQELDGKPMKQALRVMTMVAIGLFVGGFLFRGCLVPAPG